MILKIVQTGHPVLRSHARRVGADEILTDDFQRLIHDMRETMRDAPGVGLAAPQVGVSLQLAVIEDRQELLSSMPPEELAEKERQPIPFHVLINPELTLVGEERVSLYEGCLSVSGFSAVVTRARKVQVRFFDERGEVRSVTASGWYARILQHEIDHLRGTLYLDRMNSLSFTSLENWNRYWKGRPVTEILRILAPAQQPSERPT
jgi:peptide deformylase